MLGVMRLKYVSRTLNIRKSVHGLKIEETTFSMAEYAAFTASIAEEVKIFETRQRQGVEQEEIKSVY
jgi:urea carboxylase